MANFCLTEQSINLRKSLLLSFISLDFLREKLNSLNSPSFFPLDFIIIEMEYNRGEWLKEERFS